MNAPNALAPAAGSRWRHYKGGFYTVITVARREGSAEPLVIYKAASDGAVWARPITEWHELVGKDLPRFVQAAAAAVPLRKR